MIFVTVGSTYFDELIETIDSLKESGLFGSYRVICQIGQGKYQPRHVEFFRYTNEIDNYFKNSSLVITHGGATVFQLYKQKIPFIATPNTSLADDHQTTFLADIEKELKIYVAYNLNQIASVYNKAISSTIHNNTCQSNNRLFDHLAS